MRVKSVPRTVRLTPLAAEFWKELAKGSRTSQTSLLEKWIFREAKRKGLEDEPRGEGK